MVKASVSGLWAGNAWEKMHRLGPVSFGPVGGMLAESKTPPAGNRGLTHQIRMSDWRADLMLANVGTPFELSSGEVSRG